LTGKTAVVIGGASGIGEAVTLGIAKQGARVVCLDVNTDAARRVAERATADGCVCDSGELDIRDAAAVERAFDALDQ
jgi:NAD(P)-dependent dehydrogenase (short-subunit alcohol dehydrogenase family)